MPTFEWTTPVRRKDGRELSTLPIEIYLEIFSYIHAKWVLFGQRPDTSDFNTLALVCRFFYVAMVPRIFEVVHIDGKKHGDDSATAFCRALTIGDSSALTVASYVKCFVMEDLRSSWPSKDFTSLYGKAISRMTNLVNVEIEEGVMTNELLQAIVFLPNLRTLLVCCCLFRKLRKPLLDNLSNMQLHDIKVADCSISSYPFSSSDEEAEHCTSQQAFYDSLPFRSLTAIRIVDSEDWLPGCFRDSTPLANLQHLRLGTVLVGDDFPGLLHQTPNLIELEIHCLSFDSTPISLAADLLPTLPRLEHISAPMVLLQRLIPGSSVLSISVFSCDILFNDLQCPPPTERELKLISLSRQPVTTIDIPLSFYGITQFSTIFPALRFLTVWRHHDNYQCIDSADQFPSITEILTFFLDSWPTHPPLYELRIDMRDDTRDTSEDAKVFDHSYLSRLSKQIPTLRYLTIEWPDKPERWFYCGGNTLWEMAA